MNISVFIRGHSSAFFLLICCAPFVTCGIIKSTAESEPALLIVSYDGFRPEYLNRGVTPFMNQFRKEGVSAPFMYNVFPTATFVNHHTIATGLYPGKHGVLNNEVWDSKFGKCETIKDPSCDLFIYDKSILPIWTANEKAGKHSGCLYWVGSDVEYNGTACTFLRSWTRDRETRMELEDRVDTAISWFKDEITPANLVMLYIQQPDTIAHAYGPDSNEVTQVVARLDNLTNYIQQKLIENNLDKRVNVIHLSDHGMSSVTLPHFIDLGEFIDSATYKDYGSSPVLQIVPNDPNQENEIFANLTAAAKRNGHFKVYNHENLPERWHIANNRRTGPILVVADIDYAFQDYQGNVDWAVRTYNISVTNTTKFGIHGYDNELAIMHPIFMAKGPLFAKGNTLKPFNSVDLYNLFCAILNIKCNKNDGSDRMEMWNDLFADSVPRN